MQQLWSNGLPVDRFEYILVKVNSFWEEVVRLALISNFAVDLKKYLSGAFEWANPLLPFQPSDRSSMMPRPEGDAVFSSCPIVTRYAPRKKFSYAKKNHRQTFFHKKFLW